MNVALWSVLLTVLLFASVDCGRAAPTPLPRLHVYNNHRYLFTGDGQPVKPFFWLGDTAWTLLVRLTQAETEHYLKIRAAQKFTVIQAVIVPWSGRETRNAAGEMPFLEGDPTRPNEKYFAHVDAVVHAAEKLGLYMGLLPTWGDAWKGDGKGNALLTPERAEAYGEFLGRRYRENAVIWILGGDTAPETSRQQETIRALARGLRHGDNGRHLITFHPPGWTSSSAWFHGEEWLDFNMIQSGHSVHDPVNYELVAIDYARIPEKPCVDGEANYEDHPVNWKPELGYFDEYDVRKTAYWSVFAGAFGYTYGCHDVWQFYDETRPPEMTARIPWQKAITLPGAKQMQYLRKLIASRPFFTRIPDQSLIVGDPGEGSYHIQATRDEDGSYAMIYIPTANQTVTVNLRKLRGPWLTAWWFDPRTGKGKAIKGYFEDGGTRTFTTPAKGPDWVLVIGREK